MTILEQDPNAGSAGQRTATSAARPLDLRAHAAAIRRFWRTVLASTLLGAAVALGITLHAQPAYETSLTFYVASQTSGDRDTPLQASEFAQQRVNSYVGVVTSERMASAVLADTGLPISASDLSEMITASADPNTVLMYVQVVDVSRDRSMTIARSIARNLDSVIAELDNRANSGSVQLRVLSGPTLNPTPVAPRTKLNLALGLLIGLGLGVAQALLRQQFDNSVRTREQLSQLTGLPTLGALDFDASARSAPVLPPKISKSRRAEGFRQLRTNLRFVDATMPVEVLTVTSSVEGEGKTTTAANLAQSFAEAGRRVLLVDADLRKPKLEQYLDLEGSAGLTDILIGEAEFSDVVQEWGPDGLSVLASGLIPPNPSELLGSTAMEKFLQQARTDYDLVVVDTPPLLPVTDAAVTAVMSDGVILIVRHGRTKRDQVRYSLEALRSVDARVLGTVLTLVPLTRASKLPSYYVDQSKHGKRK